MKHVIIGTAGHIDHGKTSLVKALTGIDADRLKEEKQRGITIDIGFADLKLGDFSFGFVDVPGHERFVKNMLAGAHGIDLLMFVIAADEGIMPQTREHFDICRLLKIQTGLTVLTKVDMVDDELLDLAKIEVAEFLTGSFLENSPIIAVSSKTGKGIDQLKEAIVKLASSTRAKNSQSIARLPIDRAFVIKGFGTVVTGTLRSGHMLIGDELEILPSGYRSRVRGLQVHSEFTERALAGQRTAVNLQGLSLEHVERGQVLVPANRFSATSMLDVELEVLASSPKPLTQRTRVRFHHDTSELMARVVLLEGSNLEPGKRQFAQLRLESPTFALAGDRFIIRSYSPQITIGGGTIVNALAEKHRLKDRQVVPNLKRLAESRALSNWAEHILIFVEMSQERAITLGKLAARTGLTDAEIDRGVADLVRRSQILRSDTQPVYILAKAVYDKFKETLSVTLKNFHKANPLQPGVSRQQIREQVFSLTELEVFKMVIDRLVAEKVLVAERDILRLPSHQIALTEEEEQLKAGMEEKFRGAGLQALTYQEVESSGDSSKLRRLFQLLLTEQKVVKVAEFVYHRDTIDQLISCIKAQKSRNPKIDVASFKEITGLSRKHAIPLLEYLDTRRVTRRVGNEREIL